MAENSDSVHNCGKIFIRAQTIQGRPRLIPKNVFPFLLILRLRRRRGAEFRAAPGEAHLNLFLQRV